MQWIKKFSGHSGCNIDLFYNNKKYFVVKKGNNNLHKSARILLDLEEHGFKVPSTTIISVDEIHMEYINGLTIRDYILNANQYELDNLVEFIRGYILKLLQLSEIQDIQAEINGKLLSIKKNIDLKPLKFSLCDLQDRLPTNVRCGLIHGDFTFDNMIFNNGEFYLIDANPTDVRSIEYDVGKLRQDIDCGWFYRNQNNKNNYVISCKYISDILKQEFKFLNDDNILIFMLLRILPYAKDNQTKTFLYEKMNSLWQ